MKITDGTGTLDSQLIGPEAVRGGSNGSTAITGSTTGGDRVSVSETARALADLRAGGGNDDGANTRRVVALRAALVSGRYRVDPTAVAQSVLRELLSEHVR